MKLILVLIAAAAALLLGARWLSFSHDGKHLLCVVTIEGAVPPYYSVAILTFDDPVFSQSVRPALSCIAQPAYELGFRGAETLIHRLQEPGSPPSRVYLDTELRVRESTAARRLTRSAECLPTPAAAG